MWLINKARNVCLTVTATFKSNCRYLITNSHKGDFWGKKKKIKKRCLGQYLMKINHLVGKEWVNKKDRKHEQAYICF